MTQMVSMTLGEVRALAHAVLTRFGLTEAHVAAVAETMVAGERDGCASQGINRLLVCAHTIRSGKVVLDAETRIAARAPGLVRVAAGGGLAPLDLEIGRASGGKVWGSTVRSRWATFH